MSYVVGGFNPFEKYAGQIGPSPQVGVKNTKMKPPPSIYIYPITDPWD